MIFWNPGIFPHFNNHPFYISNFPLLIACIVIISGLFSILEYVIIFKNPFYYITCVGLVCITFYPSTISMIIFISSSRWSTLYEPFKFFVLFALTFETLYIFVLIRDLSHNKYTKYYHKKYGYAFRGGTLLNATYYSTREFDKLEKGRQYWQDQNPEEVQKKNEELRAYEKKFKKKLLIWFQIVAVLGFNFIFGISLLI